LVSWLMHRSFSSGRSPSGPPRAPSRSGREISIETPNHVVCFDASGDILPDTHQGFFIQDVRYLSSYLLRIDGARPLFAAAYRLSHSSVMLRATNGATRRLRPGMVKLEGTRTLDRSLHDQLTVCNDLDRPLGLEVTIDLGADFLTTGEIESLVPWRSRLQSALDHEVNDVWLTRRQGAFLRQTRVRFSQPACFRAGQAHFGLVLAPAGRWTLSIEVEGLAPQPAS
jgi:hypothetical protein